MQRTIMKKLSLLGISLALTLGFTSCEPNDDNPLPPSLNMTEETSASTGGALTINQGQDLVFTWDSRSGSAKLETFSVEVVGANAPSPLPSSEAGNTFPYEVSNDDDESYVDTLVFNNAGTSLGQTAYTFTVTDQDGETNSVEFNVTVEAASTPLGSAQSFTWERVGGNDGTGLAQFGLEWTSNSSTSAIVKTDAATKMVDLGSAAWTSITTKERLSAAISDASGINEYTGVSAQQNDTYDDVLGVSHNGTSYLIHVTNGDVSSGAAGTTITITGEYKE